ncbi:MAG: hypothetical protein FK730_05575 [Asgard group archaeon]|nr:hypothetical protein [Asgard group archaeon]
MKEKTPLETACYEVMGENYGQYYNVLSNILILNPNLVKQNDSRLSAKVTSILFDEELIDKVHIICEYLENPELNINYSPTEIDYTKILLEMDPELNNTSEIIIFLKHLPNPKYSDIVKKVPIKHELKLYRHNEGYVKRRI